MGSYFLMSWRFDKSTAESFGLIPKSEKIAINPIDNSSWEKALLYDFGWGQENGYYRTPLLGFTQLCDLAIHGTNRDDVYGATAIILNLFPEELLVYCEMLIKSGGESDLEEFDKLCLLCKLQEPYNRSPTKHKKPEVVKNDFCRWKNLSNIAIERQAKKNSTKKQRKK